MNTIDTFLYALTGSSSPWRIDNGNPYAASSRLVISGSDKVSRAINGSYMIEFEYRIPIAPGGTPVAPQLFRDTSIAPLFAGIPNIPYYLGPPNYPPHLSCFGAVPVNNRAHILMSGLSFGYVGFNINSPPEYCTVKISLFVKSTSQQVAWAMTSLETDPFEAYTYYKSGFTSLAGTYDFSRVSITGGVYPGVSESVVYGSTASIFVADGRTDAEIQIAFNNYPILPDEPSYPAYTAAIMPNSTGKISHLRILANARIEQRAREMHEIMKGLN